MTDKEAQLKAKLLKMKLAEQKKWSATGLSPEEIQKHSESRSIVSSPQSLKSRIIVLIN